jgi:hypothetical protein
VFIFREIYSAPHAGAEYLVARPLFRQKNNAYEFPALRYFNRPAAFKGEYDAFAGETLVFGGFVNFHGES